MSVLVSKTVISRMKKDIVSKKAKIAKAQKELAQMEKSLKGMKPIK